jgi:hypothetical protein
MARRRRSLVRDQLIHLATKSRKMIDAKTRHVSNRAYGIYAEAKSAMEPDPSRGGDDRTKNYEDSNGWSTVDSGYVPAEQ